MAEKIASKNCGSGKKNKQRKNTPVRNKTIFFKFGWRLIYFLISQFTIRVNAEKTFNP
jgi:preprotein translocase subunit Sec63